MEKRRVVFVTGTRADFGKLKPLMRVAAKRDDVELTVFVTGMHMLEKYGQTWIEVHKSGFINIHPFINQNLDDSMAAILGKTVLGFTDYVRERRPDAIFVHGDRIEALACASVGALTSTLVVHIEGGEVSGTVDELIRHAVSKLSHVHLVANDEAAANLRQLGESPESIHVIGSPDIDVMDSDDLPTLDEVLTYYDIPFDDYGILLFHPVTTELSYLAQDTLEVVAAVKGSGVPHIVIYPNNDEGSDTILRAYKDFDDNPDVRVIPSMSFERFLVVLRHARFVVGNSSAGIREAPHYGVPAINIGTRQTGRLRPPGVADIGPDRAEILAAMADADSSQPATTGHYGDGRSADRFEVLLDSGALWKTSVQKMFRSL